MRVQMPAVDPEAVPVGAAPRPSPDKASRAAAWLLRQSGQCLFVVALATASYFVVSHYFLQTVQVVGKSRPDEHGTTQQFKFDRQIFKEEGLDYRFETLVGRFREMAFVTRGVTINFSAAFTEFDAQKARATDETRMKHR